MMEALRSTDRQAVWLIRSRKLAAQLEFWLVAVGYNRQKHAFDSKIYLVYLVVFFSAWVFAVLALLADAGVWVLQAVPLGAPLEEATAVALAVWVAVFLIELYGALKRSPFIFSEADATLLCMTPVDRRFVALAWFASEWLVRGLVFGAGTVVLGYALLETQMGRALTPTDLPRYLLAGVRMVAISLPLHLAAQALAWASGAWRLSQQGERRGLRWVAPVLAVGLAAAWVLSAPVKGSLFPAWGWALAFPLRAGLGAAPFLAGLGAALLAAGVGVVVLWNAARGMSLGRGAHETRGQEALQAAILLGAKDVVQEITQRERLGAGRKPAKLPAGPGPWAQVWKNAVQGLRSIGLEQVAPWVSIPFVGLAVFQFSEWGVRGWMVVLWVLFVGGRALPALRKDLSRWWLLHQFPYGAEERIGLNLGLPLVGMALAGGATLAAASWLGVALPAAAGWLYFPGAVGAALAGVVDILLQCRAGSLLAGSVPDQSLVTVLLGVLPVGVAGVAAWVSSGVLGLPAWLGIGVMLAVCGGIDYGLYRWAGWLLRNIR